MTRIRVLIGIAVLATLIVVAYFWWPSVLRALQGLHGSIRLHP